MSAGHAVYCVVDEYHCYVFGAVGGVNGFAGANSSHVAVALVGEYEFVGLQALDGGCHSRCATVCSLNHVDVDVVVGKHGTAHRCNAYGIFFGAHFFNHFADDFVHGAVATAGAIVHCHVFEQGGFFVDEVFGFYDVGCFHILNLLLFYKFLFECLKHFFGRWDNAAKASVVFNGLLTFNCKFHVLNHLTGR